MHTQTVFELNQEVERLLQLALQHLNALKAVPRTVQDNGQQQSAQRGAMVYPLHFSHRGMEVQQALLHNELRKINQQEMVLAIVGTMKAGKSTTINALVGTEVLPNRNRPMTTLPTLIRHRVGQKEPVLHFPYPGPVETLMQALQQRLANCSRSTLARQLDMDADMDNLLQRIQAGTAFEKRYPGAQPIFHCLKSLNDLVRLSTILDEPFPFSAYNAIEHMPVIEVEFSHLAGLGDGLGQLTLLDTPGPNEAGQPQLQKMLQQQISRASAVLAVLDYTQLKTLPNKDLCQTLGGSGHELPLYVLVNKFDQQDRHSDNDQQVRTLIAGSLLEGTIAPDHIFPVSARWAYLANRARDELALRGALPDYRHQPWVADFAEAALGRRWRSASLNDIAQVYQAAEMLWQDSRFDSPIKTILQAAHANASLYALRTASGKLMQYASHAEDYLSLRGEELAMADNQLQQTISQLETDIDHLRTSQQGMQDTVQQAMSQALQSGADCINAYQQQLLEAIDHYFRSGSVPPLALKGAMSKALPRYPDFAAGSQQLVLEQESEARMLLHKIRASCEVILLSVQEALSSELAEHFSGLEKQLGAMLAQALQPIAARVSSQSCSGFRGHIALPAFHSSQFNFSVHELFNGAIEEQSQPAVVMPVTGGMRSTLVRWLSNGDWQWDNSALSHTRYLIDLTALHQKLQLHLSEFCGYIRQAMNAQIGVAVTAGQASFQADLQQGLAALEARLRHHQAARQQGEEEAAILRQQLARCAATARFIYQDASLLQDDIQTLLTTG